MQTIPRWTRFEAPFEARRHYENATQDVNLTVEFRHEGGGLFVVRGFWDGGRVWRVRFSPELEGRWSYSSASDDPDLNRSGEFQCIAYKGANPLYRLGAVRTAANQSHLAYADGTPFFWLGDTVWNGPLKAEPHDWELFLSDRACKGFNAIQFVPTQWVAGAGNADLRVAFAGSDSIRIDPAFYHWLDKRVDAINDFGMLAVPALIWAAPSQPWVRLNPGNTLPEDQIVVLARYLVARYGAHHVAWMLAGDGDYRGAGAERWKRIGRAVFERKAHNVTMHPMGAIWVGEEFKNEPWFTFHGYQSSHYGSDDALRWITQGPPATQWVSEPRHPVINLEPCYEAHLDMCGAPADGRKPFDAHAIRRASYWSVMASPPAGVTYGAHGVWGWEITRQVPMNHAATGITPTWREGMALPGSSHMKVLRDFFESLPWWTLEPAQEILAEQPGDSHAHAFISVVRSVSRDMAVLYLPEGGMVRVRVDALPALCTAEWVHPETGERTAAKNGWPGAYSAPAGRDWLLLLSTAGQPK